MLTAIFIMLALIFLATFSMSTVVLCVLLSGVKKSKEAPTQEQTEPDEDAARKQRQWDEGIANILGFTASRGGDR